MRKKSSSLLPKSSQSVGSDAGRMWEALSHLWDIMRTRKGAASHGHRDYRECALEYILHVDGISDLCVLGEVVKLESIFNAALVVDFRHDSSNTISHAEESLGSLYRNRRNAVSPPQWTFAHSPRKIHLLCLSISTGLSLHLSHLLVYFGFYILQVFSKCWLNAHIMNFWNWT